MAVSYKLFFSALAIAFTFIAFVPYIRDILTGATRPHMFSWIIWGVTTVVTFLAQLQDGGGLGAWPNGVSGMITLWIAWLAYIKRGDIRITATDWCFFVAALSSLPFWYFTSDPLWAVVVLTTVDVLGFGPTIRKTWHAPYSESVLFYSLFTLRNVLAIMALERYTLTTVLFPAAVALSCVPFVIMMIYRRRMLATVDAAV